MLKVLLKKQFMELYRSFFFDQKKGKSKSKSSTAVSIVLYALLMVVVLGGMFTALALSLCKPLCEIGMGWLYFAITGLIAIVLGVFGSVFSTFSGMYLAKDNDLLLSMPIPVRYILYSRLLGVYLMGLMFEIVVLLPAVIVYAVVQPFTLKFLFGAVMLIVLVSVFVLVLSCILGWVVAKISSKLKNKSIITVFAALIFFALYYFVYFKAGEALGSFIADPGAIVGKFRSGTPLYLLGRIGEGDLLSILILTVIVAALCVIVLWVLSRSFLKIVSANTSGSKTKKKAQSGQKRSASAALLSREFKRFTSSPNYMLNCGLGVLFMLILAGLALFKGGMIADLLGSVFSAEANLAPLLVCALVIFCGSMNDTTAVSVSLEGKSLWIVRSMPVDTWQVLRAKLDMQILLTAVPGLVFVLCAVIAMRVSALMAVLMLLLTVAYALLSAFFGQFVNLKKPNLTWTNEIVPLKQSMGALFSILGSWLYAIIYIVGCFLLVGLPSELYLGLFIVLTAVLALLLYRWLRKKGTACFEAL